MVYIYKKTIKGRVYYYLRVSKRVKGKIIVKDIAYLGSDLSKIEQKLSRLPAIYKKEIRKAYRNIKRFIQSGHYLKRVQGLELKSTPYLEEVEAIKLHFNEQFLRLDRTTIQEAYRDFLIDFAFNTTSLEGNTITLAEASRLLKEDMAPKNRTLREIHDLKNTGETFFRLLGVNNRINHSLIISVHDQLMENIDERKGYRTHDIRVFKAHFEASPAVYVKLDMDLLLKWLDGFKKKLHPLVLAGLFHQKFEKIHPFADGNGRTGRMIMNYMLLQGDYPPFIIRKSKRGEYLDALAKADKAPIDEPNPGDYRKLITYLAEEMVHSYWNNFLV